MIAAGIGGFAQVAPTAETSTSPVLPMALVAVAALVVVVAGGFGLVMWRRRWLIADLPTSDAAHVFVGMNEVVGTAVPVDQPLVAPYSATECVWYRSLVEREVRSGNDNRRWKTESDDQSDAPFWIEDRTGRVLVRPKGASVDAPRRHRAEHGSRPQRYGRMSVLGSLAGAGAMPPSLGLDASRYRTTEWHLLPGDPVYALGEATMRADAVALELAPSDPVTGVKKRPLLIAHGDEGTAARRTSTIAVLLLLVTMVAAAALPAAFHALREAQDDGPPPGAPSLLEATGGAMAVAAGLVLLVLAGLYVVRLFNRLVAVRNRAQAAWSLIDVHLRRRHDLLPRLADVVAAAAGHERAVQEAVARLRTQGAIGRPEALPDRATIESTEGIDRADHQGAATLLALAEAYPDLQADEGFRALHDELVRTEDGVAFARGFYNDAITVLRDRRQRFPGLLLAPLVPVPSLELWRDDAEDLSERA